MQLSQGAVDVQVGPIVEAQFAAGLNRQRGYGTHLAAADDDVRAAGQGPGRVRRDRLIGVDGVRAQGRREGDQSRQHANSIFQ
ncbi:hypothetical protein FJ251_07625 [bacterium]|nr:hypothetical protein [bacterium]